nr:hypothetical protein [uncultured Roseateles sp.]
MKKTVLLLAIAVATALAGCANTLPADPTKMSADQLQAWAKDKNANISCGVVNSPYGRGVMTYVVLDKGIVIDGSVTVDNECKVQITNSAKPKAASSP